MTTILVLKLQNRLDNSQELQKALTTFGCNIKTRIGLHDNSCGVCSPFGIIILEVFGVEEELMNMFQAIKSIKNINMKIIEV